ncbi:MAG TPA: type II secretion system protein GspK, partial [bacterium]|nr:type II secretion system protein GspK [bacterium]
MKRKNESGVVLIITLWVIVILATVSLSYVRQINLEAKMVGFQRDTMIVDSVAKAGLRQALVLLREDRIKDSAEDIQETATRFMEDDNYRYDGGSEAWADNPDLYVDVPFYEIGDKTAYYYVDVEDESAKFPINNEKTTLDMIARLLVLSGVNERDSEGLAAAIVDWRDQNDIPEEAGNAGMGGGGGEENEV